MSPDRHETTISSRELLLIFVFWTFIATLSSVNRMLDPRGIGIRGTGVGAAIILEYAEAWIWAAVTPLVFALAARYTIERSTWAVRVPMLLVTGVVIAVGAYLLLAAIRFELMPQLFMRRRQPVFSPMADILRLRFVNQLLVYLAVLAAGFARNYYLRDQRRQREAVALHAQASQLEAQLAAARLDALRMQINPHFLFNTLHAISALVERDPAGVRRMIARLSELLRYTIESRGTDEVTLKDELDFLGRYIGIMEVRFQGQLQVTIEVPEALQEALVPNLILQPIVENALEHGASRAGGEGRVTIAAARDGDDLRLSVRDNGPGLLAGGRAGVGLQNTRARLEQLYGDAAALSLSNGEEGGVAAVITLPFHTTGDLRTTADGGLDGA